MTEAANQSHLALYQQGQKSATHDKVLSAIDAIQAEIDQSGSYSHNGGKITLVEILRRAGVGETTLRNRHHHKTRQMVLDWIKNLSKSTPITKRGAHAADQKKIAAYEQALRKINSEMVVWRAERAELERIVARLRGDIDKLKKQLRDAISRDSPNVIHIVPGKS